MHTNRVFFHSESNIGKSERTRVPNVLPEAVQSDWTSIKEVTYNLKMAVAGSALPHTS